jgi:predicted phage terminase large subunit-like protein
LLPSPSRRNISGRSAGSTDSGPLKLPSSTASLRTRRFAFSKQPSELGTRDQAQETQQPDNPSADFGKWLHAVSPTWEWDYKYLVYIREQLDRVTRGEINKLMISLPPRHLKSEMVTVRYSAWRLERNPEMRVMVGAYSSTLAKRFSRKARRIAETRIPLARDRKAVDEWETEAGGSFRAAGVGAGITGMGANLIIIDDPVRNRKDAESQTYRDAVYDWYTDDLFTRQDSEGCAIIIIMTRWHEDDLEGRILASEDGPNWTVISLPAEAEEEDPLGREVGEALCPERYDLEALAERKRVMGNSYYALFQQRPQPREGLMFKRHWFEIVDAAPANSTRVRWWDNAATEGDGDYTAGVLLARSPQKIYYVEDVVRGQWSAYQREEIKKQTAALDAQRFGSVAIWNEQEPGSAGKESAAATVKNLEGYDVHTEPSSGDKIVRAEPFAAQCEAGNVKIVKGAWNAPYLTELTSFPTGKNDDQVDGSSGGFNKLALGDHGWMQYVEAQLQKKREEEERKKREQAGG